MAIRYCQFAMKRIKCKEFGGALPYSSEELSIVEEIKRLNRRGLSTSDAEESVSTRTSSARIRKSGLGGYAGDERFGEASTKRGKTISYPRYRWSAQELSMLRRHWPNLKALRQLLPNRTELAIVRRAKEMGLPRRYEYIKPLRLTDFESGFILSLLEGEGTISIRKYKCPYRSSGFKLRPEISIANTSSALVEVTRGLIGGTTRKIVSGRRRKPLYQLRIIGIKRTLPILLAVKDHLIVKKRRCELVIRFCQLAWQRLKTRVGGKAARYASEEVLIVKKIRKLNVKGESEFGLGTYDFEARRFSHNDKGETLHGEL